MRRAMVGLLAVLTLAGCASAPVHVMHRGTASTVAGTSAGVRLRAATFGACPSGRIVRATREQLRAFRPVGAMRCVTAERTYPDGEWTVQIQQVTTDGVEEFARSLDAPDAALTHGACTDDLVLEPAIVLLDPAGHRLVPHFPRGACAKPLVALQDVLTHWQQIGRPVRVLQQRTRAEIDTHCGPAYKDVIRLDDQYGHLGVDPGGPLLTRGDQDTLYVCVMRVGHDPIVGEFVRGVTLHGRDAATMRTALSGAGASGPCTAPGVFATVADPAGELVTVELGGCGRVERDRPDAVGRGSHGTFGRADLPTVRRLLDA